MACIAIAKCCQPIFETVVVPNDLFVNDSIVIPLGVDNGFVPIVGSPFSPAQIILSVRRASGNLLLWADDILASRTPTGFQYELNGITDAADYILDYMLIGNNADVPFAHGSANLPLNQDNGSVSYNLTFMPAQILTTIARGGGDLLFRAEPRTGSITPSGFQYDLNGVTDAPDYWIDWIALPP